MRTSNCRNSAKEEVEREKLVIKYAGCAIDKIPVYIVSIRSNDSQRSTQVNGDNWRFSLWQQDCRKTINQSDRHRLYSRKRSLLNTSIRRRMKAKAKRMHARPFNFRDDDDPPFGSRYFVEIAIGSSMFSR